MFFFFVNGLLSSTDSLILILLKQSNKSFKNVINFVIYVDLLFKRLNETYNSLLGLLLDTKS